MNNKFKEVKCIDCNKTIIINKHASAKTARCQDCKYIKYLGDIKYCIICGKKFRRRHSICCSEECSKIYLQNRKQYLSKETLLHFQEIGKKSAQIQSEIRRSKNEIEFCTLCENYFNNVEHNKAIFNGWDADIIIHDIKFAILWNGKWHYEQFMPNTSLKQIQNRDQIKLQEIQNIGYIPYIIKDIGKHNNNFVQEQFDEFIKYLKENNYIIK